VRRSGIAICGLRAERVALVLALLTAGCFVSPPAADAQSSGRPYRIGVLHTAFFEEIPSVAGLKAGLKALGLEESRDVYVRHSLHPGEARRGSDSCGGIGQERRRSRLRPNGAVGSSRERRHADDSRRLRRGRRPRCRRPGNLRSASGGNITGISSLATELTPKRLEILKVMFPAVRRVWAVYYANDLSSAEAARKAREVATLLKLDVVAQAVRTPESWSVT